MRREELDRVLKIRPFKPVKLFLSDGGTVDINHPDLCMLLTRTAIVGIPASAQGAEGDDFQYIDLAHVSRFIAGGTSEAAAESGREQNGE